jgi:hypothetical protein
LGLCHDGGESRFRWQTWLEHYIKIWSLERNYAMASVVTINRPDVVTLIEDAARPFTGGNKTEAVAMAVRGLLQKNARTGSLFGLNPGSVRFRDGVHPLAPALDVVPDAESGAEIDR